MFSQNAIEETNEFNLHSIFLPQNLALKIVDISQLFEIVRFISFSSINATANSKRERVSKNFNQILY